MVIFVSNTMKGFFNSCCCFLLLAFNTGLSAQAPIKDLSVGQQLGKLFVSFSVLTGNTCLGIDIERKFSMDASFDAVGHIAGVCGSATQDVNYTFADELPARAGSYEYRIFMPGYGYSELVSIAIYKPTDNGILFIQDPLSNNLQFVFTNKFNSLNFMIIAANGVLAAKGSFDALDNTIIPFDGAGLYYLLITNKEELVYQSSFIKFKQ